MDAIISVDYHVHIEDDDAKNIENDTMTLRDIDVSHYIDNCTEAELIDVFED